MDRLKVAIVGAGGIGKFHVRSFLRRPDVQICSLCDTNPAVEAVLQKLYEEEGHQLNVGSLFETDPMRPINEPAIQAVTIATPNFTHRDLAVAALQAGKHVLLEKPPARNLAEAMQIHDAWQQAVSVKSDLVGMMVLNNNLRPEVKKLFELCRSCTIGVIRRIKVVWNRRWGIPVRGAWFTKKTLSGGGPLIDLAPHLLGIVLELVGWETPASLIGWTWADYSAPGLGDGPYGGGAKDPTETMDVEDSGKIVMNYPGGLIVEVEAAWAVACEQEEMTIEVTGSKGKVVFQRVWPINDGDDAKAIDSFNLYTYGQMAGRYVDLNQCLNPCTDPRNADPWMGRLAMVSHFVDCVQGNAKPIADFGHALTIQRIIEEAYASAGNSNVTRLFP